MSSLRKQQELLWKLGDINIGVGTPYNQHTCVWGSRAYGHKAARMGSRLSPTCMWMKRLGQYWSERVGWVPKKSLSVSCRGYPLPFELDQQLGLEFDGIISSDDFSVQQLPAGSQQKCLAHLRRHFKSGQVSGNNPALDNKVLDLMRLLLNIGGSGEKPRMRALSSKLVGFKSRITQSIQQWIVGAGYEAGVITIATDKAEQWWYFDHPEVPGQQPGRALCV